MRKYQNRVLTTYEGKFRLQRPKEARGLRIGIVGDHNKQHLAVCSQTIESDLQEINDMIFTCHTGNFRSFKKCPGIFRIS